MKDLFIASELLDRNLFSLIPKNTSDWLVIDKCMQDNPLAIEIKKITSAVSVVCIAFFNTKHDDAISIIIDLGFNESDVHLLNCQSGKEWPQARDAKHLVEFSREMLTRLMFSFWNSLQKKYWCDFGMRIFDITENLGGIKVYSGGIWNESANFGFIESAKDFLPFIINEYSYLDDVFV